VTGSIASGKSTVIAALQEKGVAVIQTDVLAKTLTEKGSFAFERIVAYFGNTVLDSSGALDRKALRARIFSQPQERLWLENLLHPLIRKKVTLLVANLPPTPYCLIEIPLLRRKEDYPYLDRILLVQTTSTLQIQRIMQRDTSSLSLAKSILQTQPQKEEQYALADDILTNIGSLPLLLGEIEKIHKKYLQLAKEKS
jgi:dephospho-CoA kinase